MIIMNRRIVQEILPVIVIGFLNEWLLRVFILVSLFSQIELLLLGNRRKYTPGNWLRSIIWQAYATKDAIIDIFIGVLFKCQGIITTKRHDKGILATISATAPWRPGHHHSLFFRRQ